MCCTMHASEDSRRDLDAIEKQIETARKETRRSLTRVVRDASLHLGTLEARGQKDWRKMSARAHSEVERPQKTAFILCGNRPTLQG